MYLVDTNVLSVGAPARSHDHAAMRAAAWLEAESDRLFLSVVTAAEVEDGIAKARRTGASKKAAVLAGWWEHVLLDYADRILPLDLEAARTAGRLMDMARAAGTDPGFEDLAIAATASRHGLVVATRNSAHFERLGVAFVDPFAV